MSLSRGVASTPLETATGLKLLISTTATGILPLLSGYSLLCSQSYVPARRWRTRLRCPINHPMPFKAKAKRTPTRSCLRIFLICRVALNLVTLCSSDRSLTDATLATHSDGTEDSYFNPTRIPRQLLRFAFVFGLPCSGLPPVWLLRFGWSGLGGSGAALVTTALELRWRHVMKFARIWPCAVTAAVTVSSATLTGFLICQPEVVQFGSFLGTRISPGCRSRA